MFVIFFILYSETLCIVFSLIILVEDKCDHMESLSINEPLQQEYNALVMIFGIDRGFLHLILTGLFKLLELVYSSIKDCLLRGRSLIKMPYLTKRAF